LGLSGAIFVNIATRDLGRAMPDATAEEISSSLTGGGGHFFDSLSEETQAAALKAIITASDSTFAFILASAALSFILSWFLRWEKVF